MTAPTEKALETRRAAFLRSPEDTAAALDLATQLERIGDLSSAFAVLDLARETSPHEELDQRIRNLTPQPDPSRAGDLQPLPAGEDAKGKPAVTALAFDSSARRLAVGTRGGDLWLHDLQATDTPPTRRGRVPRGVTSLAFSPDGATLVSGGADQTIRTWPTGETGKGETVAEDLAGYILGVAAYRNGLCGASLENTWIRSPDGEESLTDYDLFEPLAPSRLWCTPEGARQESRRFQTSWADESPDGGKTARVVFPGLGSHALDSLTGISLVNEPTGSVVALLSGGVVEVVRTDGEILRHEHPEIFPSLRSFFEAIPVAAISREGRALLTGSHDEDSGGDGWSPPYEDGARLFLLGAEIHSIPLAEDLLVTAVAFSPCGRHYALGCGKGEVLFGTIG